MNGEKLRVRQLKRGSLFSRVDHGFKLNLEIWGRTCAASSPIDDETQPGYV